MKKVLPRLLFIAADKASGTYFCKKNCKAKAYLSHCNI